MKLYHYVHCPFCLRVRMAFGALDIPWESITLDYDDEETPVKLAGKKMLPVVEWDSGKIMNESLDIIAVLDSNNTLRREEVTEEFDQLLNRIAGPLFKLAMPHLVWTKEFTEKSRTYFQTKKERSRGSFNKLVQNQQQYTDELNQILVPLASDLKDFHSSNQVTLKDILLASHLWSLYLVPEFQFPPVLHDYLQWVKGATRFNYQQDLWG